MTAAPARTYVVTGGASGIGSAATDLLRAEGGRVVTVDRRDADVVIDLADPQERSTLADRVVRLGVEVVDGVLPAAGLSAAQADAETVLAVNFFGAVQTARLLRPLLARSAAPRVCFVSSIGLLAGTDDEVVARCLAEDEDAALALVAADHGWVYERSKRALSAWVRREAVDPHWLSAGILLNAVAPGLTDTRMAARITGSPETMATLFASYPHPLGPGRAVDVARVATFLLAADCRHVVGQTIFVDGGHEAVSGPAGLPVSPRPPAATASDLADRA